MSARDAIFSTWLCIQLPLAALAPGFAVASGPTDAMLDLPGERVTLTQDDKGWSYQDTRMLEGAGCLEVRVREAGTDMAVTLSGRPEHPPEIRVGRDAEISRYGLSTAVYCDDRGGALSLSVRSSGSPKPAMPFVAFRFWAATDKARHQAIASLADALDGLASGQSSKLAERFGQAAALLEAVREPERAALAWMLANRAAQADLNRELAATAFEHADALFAALHWTRYRVVLLNNRSLFLAPEDGASARRLIAQAVALERQGTGDPILANVLKNNSCLIEHQYGELAAAEACFREVLAAHERLGSGSESVGATQNNAALVDLSRGRYREARTEFLKAADKRQSGGPTRGSIESLGNAALCAYQLGDVSGAIRELHRGLDEASRIKNPYVVARMSEYLAAIHLALGDTEVAANYAGAAHQIYRDGHRTADLAPVLRLLARVELERGHGGEARAYIEEAWDLAVRNSLSGPAANIAPVYARILLATGSLDETAVFLKDARRTLPKALHATDLAMLDAVEVSHLRLAGEHARAARLADRLLERLTYPGQLRTRVQVEKLLIDVASRSSLEAINSRYRRLLSELQSSIALVPDPELALRTQELARPAAEAVVGRVLDGCGMADSCDAAALDVALRFLALEPVIAPRAPSELSDEARGLLQALSQFEATGGRSKEAESIRRRLKALQTSARLERGKRSAPKCIDCAVSPAADAKLVFFMGDTRGWRWQRSGSGWQVAQIAGWQSMQGALQKLSEGPAARRDAFRTLAPLTADLEPFEGPELVITGDPRAWRVPFAALPVGGGRDLLDLHAIRISTRGSSTVASAATTARFAVGDTGAPLPSIVLEREAFRSWAARMGLQVSESESAPRARYAHISAHGERDVGGMAVLMVGKQPIMSFLSPEAALAETVLINACESAAGSTYGLAQSSIATTFLRSGARQVVATLFPVSDRDAGMFAKEFYQRYELGSNNLSEAVRAAQQTLRGMPSREGSWAAYVILTASSSVDIKE